MSREYIVYEGTHFTIEWYFSKNGKSQSLNYFNDLDSADQRKLLYLVKRIGDFGRISDKTKFRNEKELALRNKEEYFERLKRGEYYE